MNTLGKARWAALAVAVLGTVTLVGADVSGASETFQSSNFQMAGDVVATGAPTPNVPGATGSFELNHIDRTAGAISREVSDDDATVYVRPGTKFYSDPDGDGKYAVSTMEQVVSTGQRVFVAGRFDRSGDQYTLFANYVWNPPPPPLQPGHVNPKPTKPADYLVNRLFSVTGMVTETGAKVVGDAGWNEATGFTMGNFSSYGCGTAADCRVHQIALAHADHLRIYTTPLTAYWLGDGSGGYRKTTDRASLIKSVGTTQGLKAVGKYTWDGLDWRFIATNLLAPPPSTSPAGGPTAPYRTFVHEDQQGINDPATGIWADAIWSGTVGAGSHIGGGSVSMTLNWHQSEVGWDFEGVYTVAAPAPGQTSLSGDISGTVLFGSNAPLNATVTVTQATGDWNGWTGYGTYEGTANYDVGSSGDVTPPIVATATFKWTLMPPS
jgi:hypothetical protein